MNILLWSILQDSRFYCINYSLDFCITRERFAEIRRQRNEHAFSEWMAAKQRQKKRKENQVWFDVNILKLFSF